MKVLFVTRMFPEGNSWGIFIKETALAVSKFHQVMVMHVSGARGQKERFRLAFNSQDGLQVLRVTYRDIPFLSSYASFVKGTVMAFEKLLSRDFKPDILNACVYKTGIPANIIRKKYGIPYVLREGYSGFMRGTMRRFELKRARIAMENAGYILPVSKAQEEAIRSCGINGKFEVVRNIVPDYFLYAPEMKNRSGTKKVLCVAMQAKKNIPNLINACKILREKRQDFSVDIVGESEEKEGYINMVRSLSLENLIRFPGSKPKNEIAKLMQSADFFVLPSKYEPSGNVLVESLSCGLPVVATRVGGIPEVINDSNGVLVESDNSPALAEKMEWMMDNC
ncbi:MAG: glycosyltransferase, partial [Candidatus Omnitrophica bacterium]|nr:glycosyltransferase [Candidatus Omnitrophota bacterium]